MKTCTVFKSRITRLCDIYVAYALNRLVRSAKNVFAWSPVSHANRDDVTWLSCAWFSLSSSFNISVLVTDWSLLRCYFAEFLLNRLKQWVYVYISIECVVNLRAKHGQNPLLLSMLLNQTCTRIIYFNSSKSAWLFSAIQVSNSEQMIPSVTWLLFPKTVARLCVYKWRKSTNQSCFCCLIVLFWSRIKVVYNYCSIDCIRPQSLGTEFNIQIPLPCAPSH